MDAATADLQRVIEQYQKLTIFDPGKSIEIDRELKRISDGIYGPRRTDLDPNREPEDAGNLRPTSSGREPILFGLDAGQLVLITIAGFAIWGTLLK